MANAEPVGAKIYISSVPNSAAVSKSQFAALTFVEVKDVETIPALGNTFNNVKFTPLATGQVNKKKGSKDAGDPELVCFENETDPGQILCRTAATVKSWYAWKIEIPDAASASAANTVIYFHSPVFSDNTEVGAADNIPRSRFGLGITDTPLKVPTV